MRDLAQRVETLETHVLSPERDRPGLLLRMDRIENILRLAVLAGGLAFGWRVIEVAVDFLLKKP